MDSVKQQRHPTSAWAMYRAFGGLSCLCALLIVGAFLMTEQAIKRNRAEALEQALFLVLPGSAHFRTFLFDVDGFIEIEDGEGVSGQFVYAGYDSQDRLMGLALEASGMGYQDTISLLYGYQPESQLICGLKVLLSKETPGLGDKIESYPSFLASFQALDVSLTEDGSALRNRIVAVKEGQKQQAWEIDGITGATISSKAVADALYSSAQAYIPEIRRSLSVFERGDKS